MGRGVFADFVYVIAGSHGLVKVGVSADPIARLATLQTGSAHHLHLAHSAPINGDAYAAEAEAHTLLAKYRASGEWFAVPADVAVAAVSAAAFRYSRPASIAEPARPRWWLRYAVITAIFGPVWTFATPVPFVTVATICSGWMSYRLAVSRFKLDARLAAHWFAVAAAAIVTSMLLAAPFVSPQEQARVSSIQPLQGKLLMRSR